MEKIIEIPEGYEARIEGNKVVLEPKESEDERVRKWLIEMVEELRKANPTNAEHNGNCSEAIAYLERQKEQKPINDHPVFRVGDYIRNKRTGDKVLIEQINVKFKCYYYVSSDGVADVHSDLSWAEQDNWELIGQKIEQKPIMIQWTGKNLKEVIDFTGKSKKFSEWFKSWKDFENYVHAHDDIFKLFCEDGSHYEVPVGAWIVKTPDGYNIPSLSRFIQKPAEWSEEDEKMLGGIIERGNSEIPRGECGLTPNQVAWLETRLKSLRPQPHWKPSEDQIQALYNILQAPKKAGSISDRASIVGLIHDLKKLM